MSTGTDAPGITPLVATGDLSPLVTDGADEAASWSLDGSDTSGLPTLSSKGDAVTYAVSGDTLTASANDGGGARTVFDLVLNSDGTYTFTLYDQLDHASGNGQNALVIDFSSVVDATDYDGDTVTLAAMDFEITVVDDVPSIGPIASAVIDFAASATVTNTLNGEIGADENDSNDEASDGSKTYTFSSFTTDTTAVADLKSQLIEDDTKVVYFTDGAGGAAAVYDDGIDTLFYDVVLEQSTEDYTFTVYEDPIPAKLEFEFSGFPSGNQIYGVFGAIGSEGDDGNALLVLPEDLVLKNNGTLNNKDSTTLNSSKSDGSITALAISNNSINPGEAMYFGSIFDPEPDSIVVEDPAIDFDKSSYKDGDTLGFNGTVEFLSASMEIAQTTPNGSLVDIQISAYDIDPGVVGNGTSGEENNDFLQAPLATDDQVNITSVSVFDGDGALVELWEDVGVIDGVYVNTLDGDPSSVVFNMDATGIHSATILDAADDYTIMWVTETGADLWRVANVDSSGDGFDIGGFNLEAAQPTPDQKFDYVVQITDFDGDTATSGFSIGLDGTGEFDDDMVAGVIV